MYGNFVAGKPPVGNVDVSAPRILSTRERDPKFIKLEQQVNNQMQAAIAKLEPVQPKNFLQPSNKVKMVSYEDAIKELANTFKPTDNKS